MKRMTKFKLLGNLDDLSMMVLTPIGWVGCLQHLLSSYLVWMLHWDALLLFSSLLMTRSWVEAEILVGILVIRLLVLSPDNFYVYIYMTALATNKKQLLRAIVGDIIGEVVDRVTITNTYPHIESLWWLDCLLIQCFIRKRLLTLNLVVIILLHR